MLPRLLLCNRRKESSQDLLERGSCGPSLRTHRRRLMESRFSHGNPGPKERVVRVMNDKDSQARRETKRDPRLACRSVCLAVCVMSSHTYTHTRSQEERQSFLTRKAAVAAMIHVSLSRRQGVARGKSDKSADGIKSPASLAPTLAHTQSLAYTGRRGETSSLQRHSNRRSSATAALASLTYF